MAAIRREKSLFILWVVANSAGWVLGIIVVIALATLQESTHVGNAVDLGAGMGWSVGLAQWLIARKWFDATSRWMWASTIAMFDACKFWPADTLELLQVSFL